MKVKTDLNFIHHAFKKLSTFFTLSTMLNDLFKRPQHLVQQGVERMLNQMSKPFKRALKGHQNRRGQINAWMVPIKYNITYSISKDVFLHAIE